MVATNRARTAARAGDEVFVAVCCGAAVALAVYLSRGVWDDGIPIGSDMGAHFVRAETAWDRFFPQGRIDGWQTRFGLGYQQSLFLGPGFSLLAGLLRLLSLGTLTTVGSVKLAMVLAYAAMPPATAVLAWAFGLGRRSIGVAAILSLGVSVTLGGAGLAGMFTWALVPNMLGADLAVLAAAGVVLVLRRPSTGRVLFTAVSLALVIVTHPWAAIVVVVFTLCAAVAFGLDWLVTHHSSNGPWAARALLREVLRPGPDDRPELRADPVWRTAVEAPARRAGALLVAGALGVALAGVQVLPLVAHRDLKGVDTVFADAPLLDRLGDALRGEDNLRPGMMVLVIAGLVYAALVARVRRPLALPVALTPVLYLVVARAARHLWPANVVAVQLTNRSLFFVGTLGVLAAAMLVGEIGPVVAALRTLLGFTGPRRRPPLRPLAAFALVVVPTAVILVPEPPPNEWVAAAAPTPALVHAAEELHRRVPDTGRYAVQFSAREEERAGMWQPWFWLAWASGRNSLNNYNLESSAVSGPLYEGEELGRHAPTVEVERLQRVGVTHVLLIEPEAVPALLANWRMEVVWAEGGLAIAEVRGADGRPSPVPAVWGGAPVAGRVVRADPEHLAFEIASERARRVTLAVGWSPKWRATVDGRPAALGRDRQSQLTVALPEGTATLELDYGPDVADGLGTATSALAAVLAAALALRRRRPRRSGPPGRRWPRRGRRAGPAAAVVEPPTADAEPDPEPDPVAAVAVAGSPPEPGPATGPGGARSAPGSPDPAVTAVTAGPGADRPERAAGS
jgi:hypothetical protein